MLFCPKCRYEYREGILKCPDCGSKLVAELPPLSEAPSGDLDWVKLVALGSDMEVGTTRAVLESSGIPVVVMPEAVDWTRIYRAGTEADQTIYVPSSRVKEAKAILAGKHRV